MRACEQFCLHSFGPLSILYCEQKDRQQHQQNGRNYFYGSAAMKIRAEEKKNECDSVSGCSSPSFCAFCWFGLFVSLLFVQLIKMGDLQA